MNSIVDRALSEHLGSGLFVKKASGKYSILLPVTSTGENGGSPEALQKTAVGNNQHTFVDGRQENPQKTIPFFAHRDNFRVLEKVKNTPLDFLRVLPDFTAIQYSGKLTYKTNSSDVGSLEEGELTITPTTPDVFIDNCYDLIEDTALITNDLPSTIKMGVATKTLDVVTLPSDATISVASETVAVATVAVTDKKVTITGLTEGSTIVTIKASKAKHADFVRSVLVIVE